MNIIDSILKIPEIELWPDLAEYIHKMGDPPMSDWTLPLLVCEAISGDSTPANPCASAIACLQTSIILVDDLIDQEPDGEYMRLGPGRTANYSLALQAAAFRLLSESGVQAERMGTLISKFAQAAIETARGQDLDSENFGDEEDYWTVVSAKSTPFYGVALHSGALAAGASSQDAERFWHFGIVLGEIIQVLDDIEDALHFPAKPDWDRPQNNLLILFSLVAEHPDKERLEKLIKRTDTGSALKEAQSILLRSGAISYCINHIDIRYKKLVQMAKAMPMQKPRMIMSLIEDQAKPVRKIFEIAEIEVPPELELHYEEIDVI